MGEVVAIIGQDPEASSIQIDLKNSQSMFQAEFDHKVAEMVYKNGEFAAQNAFPQPDNDGTNACAFLSIKIANEIDGLYQEGRCDNKQFLPVNICEENERIITNFPFLIHQQYLKKFDLLSPAQSGFRQNHSTESAVIYFTDEIRRNADARRLTGALFVDLKKAFDTVPHKELISKLECFGFVDNSIAWFTNYLSNRSLVVSLGTNSSSPLAVENGVSQRSILGTVLFTLYINDLPSCINFSNIIMYADDKVIFFSSAQLMEVELKLNMELTSLSEWLCGNKLLLNLKKTEFMVFGTQQRLCRQAIDGIDITLGGESVKCCDTFKYLGVILDSSLSLNQHIDHVKKKVSKMLGIFSRARASLTIESANRVFKSMILPILDYCGAVFHICGKGNEECLESLQRRGGRIVLNAAHPFTEQMFTSLGWDTLTRRRETHMLNWLKSASREWPQVISRNIFK